ncbi:ribonuclease PH [Prochlorococcus sp. MIT 1341]|uniref:ribonuclease PH n=1 Tax=Prochlorococcus sp. MIT 1341 TaxID=3096221 RepID=UPI002A7542BC|nr:ribonuclease PH [Prochlorococcus sp. MIT 1341]
MPITTDKRSDGRSPSDLRPFKVTWEPMGFALSSLIVQSGKTSVICSISLNENIPKWREGDGKGWLSAEYRLLPGSTPQRQTREFLKLSGRTQEIQRLIGRSLRSVLDMKVLGERTLLVDCDVIQADAGTRTTAITGAWMALYRAGEILTRQGVLQRNPVVRQVAAVSVGLLDGEGFLDLNYSEDANADVDFNVVMSPGGHLLECQGTAERASFTRPQLNGLLDMAEVGLESLFASQKASLEH